MSTKIKNIYIKEKYINNLLNYKYKGDDLSIFNVYVINPFCNYIVNYFPTWLAPNVITISGIFFNLANSILTTYYGGWKGCDHFPPWVCFFVPISYSLYILLDYTDGKQARRLKASSPLGLLIDHGVDSFAPLFVTINLGILCGFEDFYQYFMLYYGIVFTFFLNTWEEYYVGELVLPIIHGVSEGTLLIDYLCFVSGIDGTKYYLKNSEWFGIKRSDLLGVVVVIGGTMFGFLSIIGVLRRIPKKNVGSALKNTIILGLFFLALLSIQFLGDSVILKKYPRFLIVVFGFLFAKLMGILQLSHILGAPFNPYRPIFLVPIFSLLIHNVFYYFTGLNLLVSIDAVIIGVFIFNVISWAHFVYFCSEEICELCNIHRFVLGKRYPDRKQYGEEDKKSS